MNILVFDTEAQKTADEVGGWGNSDKMGVSCVGAWRSDTGMYRIWTHEEIKGFTEWMDWAEIIVGYNQMAYDYKALSPYMDVQKYINRKTNIDLNKGIKSVYGKFAPLDSVAEETLGVGKTKGVSGKDAPKLFKDGNWPKLFGYLLDDVQITTKLFYHMLIKKQFTINKITYNCNLNIAVKPFAQMDLFGG